MNDIEKLCWQESTHTDKIYNYIDVMIAIPEWVKWIGCFNQPYARPSYPSSGKMLSGTISIFIRSRVGRIG